MPVVLMPVALSPMAVRLVGLILMGPTVVRVILPGSVFAWNDHGPGISKTKM
jgi:hypothetical protein